MPTPPALLNDDGSASMATALMMSHHGFRRDLALFARGLAGLGAGDAARTAALREEWKSLEGTLHGHHEAEDQRLFPHLRSAQPQLAPIIDRLTADHRRIDPLLEKGGAAFAALPATEAASALVAELSRMLDEHLAIEEAEIVPFLREAKDFPAPTNDEEMQMFVDGFAWSSHGIAPEVLDRLQTMLPPVLTAKLPAARAAFAERCLRVWGTSTTGASRTPVPDWLAAG